MPTAQQHEGITWKMYACLFVLLVAAFAVTLYLMGQVLICKCGYVKLWHGVTFSSENSQHISDWYTFSHIIHGIGFYALFRFLGKRFSSVGSGWPVGLLLLLSLVAEMSWELFENTDFVINRYREVTISLDYYGDSVVNSIFDVLFMVAGFFFAWRTPVWASIALVILLEALVGYSIRDNLALNIIMLLYPMDVILQWQSGA